MVSGRAVKPRGCRRVIDPGMIRARVIDHVVYEHLHSQAVSIGDQRLVFLHRSHVIVERVEIYDVVAVVVRISVLPDGSEP